MMDFQDVIIDTIKTNLKGLGGIAVAYESGVAMNIGSVVVLDAATLDESGRIRFNFQSGYWTFELFDGKRNLTSAATVNAIAVRFWPPGKKIKGMSAAVVEWAPEGNWALAGTYPAGYYERHDYLISHLAGQSWR